MLYSRNVLAVKANFVGQKLVCQGDDATKGAHMR